MSSTRSGGLAERPARWRSLHFMVSSSDRLTSQRSILWTTHRMPRMPEGEGGEARGRLSCSRVISLWWLKDPLGSCHGRVPGVVRVEDCGGGDRVSTSLKCSGPPGSLAATQGGGISGASLLDSLTAAAAENPSPGNAGQKDEGGGRSGRTLLDGTPPALLSPGSLIRSTALLPRSKLGTRHTPSRRHVLSLVCSSYETTPA